MKILVLHPKGYGRNTFFTPHLKEQLEGLGEVYWNDSDEAMDESRLISEIHDKDACITGWELPVFTEKVFDSAEKLKFIGHIGGSIKQFLPVEVFSRGITVTNVGDPMARYIAEGTLALMLALIKDIVGYNNRMKLEKAWPPYIMYTTTLFEKKIGLVGLGRIGRYLIDMLKPFDVEISVYDPYINKNMEEQLDIKLKGLDEVLSVSEIISIHAASTPETYKMLNMEKLQMIPYGAFLINTARAAIFDESALIGELKRGRFSAAIDVFHQEPLPADNELRSLPNVILTPHTVGMTLETRHKMTQCVINDLRAFQNGQPLKFPVTKDIYNTIA